MGAVEALQMTSGESDFLFDEDVDTEMEKQQEYGEEELEEEDEELSGADGEKVLRKPEASFKEVQVLKQEEFQNQSSESSAIDDDEKDEGKGDQQEEEFLNADGKINWQWIFL